MEQGRVVAGDVDLTIERSIPRLEFIRQAKSGEQAVEIVFQGETEADRDGQLDSQGEAVDGTHLGPFSPTCALEGEKIGQAINLNDAVDLTIYNF